MQPRVGTWRLTATLTDDDGGVTGDTWQWARSDAMDGTYTDIGGATSASYMPVAGDENMYLRATAMYTDGHGPDKSMMAVSVNMVIANTAPVFAEAMVVRSVEENTVAGMYILPAVAATDAENDMLTYTLGGADMASFDIDVATGQLMTMADLDFETETSYSVDVTATDPSGLSATVMVTIMVTNMNEAPAFEAETAGLSVAENTAADMAIGEPVEATDADDDTLTYTLGGDDMASFAIDADTGQLMTMAALDFEMKASYTVDVTATDPSGLSDTVMVTVMVTNMNEMGMVTLSAMQPTVGMEIMATLTDLDMVVDMPTVMWQWASSSDMSTWTDIEDATSASYMPVDGDANMYLRATAMYTDGYGPDKSEMAVSANMVVGLATDRA